MSGVLTGFLRGFIPASSYSAPPISGILTDFNSCPSERSKKMFTLWHSRSQPDIELGQPGVPFINGFPSTASFIASDPDHSFSIYPAFHRLSSRNLLYLEAELWELQQEQDVMDIQDSRGDLEELQYFRSWKRLSNSREPRQVQRMEMIGRIRTKLKEYRESLG